MLQQQLVASLLNFLTKKQLFGERDIKNESTRIKSCKSRLTYCNLKEKLALLRSGQPSQNLCFRPF